MFTTVSSFLGALANKTQNLKLGGHFLASFTDAIAAVNPPVQATGAILTTDLNRVVTIGTTGDGVTLQLAVPGAEITVINAHASNAVAVFPFLGDKINAVAINGSFSIAATKTCVFYCTVALQWHTLLSA